MRHAERAVRNSCGQAANCPIKSSGADSFAVQAVHSARAALRSVSGLPGQESGILGSAPFHIETFNEAHLCSRLGSAMWV